VRRQPQPPVVGVLVGDALQRGQPVVKQGDQLVIDLTRLGPSSGQPDQRLGPQPRIGGGRVRCEPGGFRGSEIARVVPGVA
jgi:hypothetical protein